MFFYIFKDENVELTTKKVSTENILFINICSCTLEGYFQGTVMCFDWTVDTYKDLIKFKTCMCTWNPIFIKLVNIVTSPAALTVVKSDCFSANSLGNVWQRIVNLS